MLISRVREGIRSEILGVFEDDDQVTTEDLLALDVVELSPANLLTEFVANLELTSTSTDLTLSLDTLAGLGLDLRSFLTLTQSEPLQLEAALDLRFGFGLDGATGDFYIEDPTLVARVTLDHENPFDISLSVGPLGIGIEDGTIFFQAGVMLPTEGRYGVADLENLEIGSPRFDPQSSYEVDLPFKLQGALAGLIDEVGHLSGSFNRDGNADIDAEKLTASQFFRMIPETLNFDGPNFGALSDLKNVSLDAALDGIKTTLESAIDPEGAAYRKLPFINQSAVDLLGTGSLDVVEAIIHGIDVVQENLTDINCFEIDLNQTLNDILKLNLDIGGEETDAAYDNLMALSTSLSSQSTDDELAVALAVKNHDIAFAALVLDRDVAAANERFAERGLTVDSTDLELAEAIANSDELQALELQALKDDRDLVAANAAFVEAWDRLTQYGFTGDTLDPEIDALFDSSELIASALECRALLDDANATDEEKQAAKIHLLRLGIAENATEDGIRQALNRSEEIAQTKLDRDLVRDTPQALKDAAARLKERGQDGNSTDLALATEVAGVENLDAWKGDRDLLRSVGAGSFKTQLEALEEISSATVTSGAGTSGDPWIIEYTTSDTGLDAAIGPVGMNVHVEARTEVSGTYTQKLYLDNFFQVDYGVGTALTITEPNASAELEAALEALDAIDSVQPVTGAGTPEDPWIVEYTSAGPELSGRIESSETNVDVTPPMVAHTAYRQEIFLDADYGATAFELTLGTDTLTITTGDAINEFQNNLPTLAVIDTVAFVSGGGKDDNPWIVEYTTSATELLQALSTTNPKVHVGTHAITHTTYKQNLYLAAPAESFQVEFASSGDALTVSEASASTDLQAGLQALDAVGSVQPVTGTGTRENPWIVAYTSAGPMLSGWIASSETNVNVTAPMVTRTAYRQEIYLDSDYAATAFELTLGTDTLTINNDENAHSDLKKKLRALATIDTVEVSGVGTDGNPWIVQYAGKPGMTVGALGTTSPNDVHVGEQTIVHTTYAQTIYLADSFEIKFGDSGAPITISIADAAVAGPADAVAHLLANGLTANATDGEIARALIDPAAYELRKADRDIVARYDANKSIDLAYQDSVLDLEFSMAKAVKGYYDLAFDLEDLPGLGELLTQDEGLALDLTSDGQVYIDADMNFDLNFTFDLSSLVDPKFIIYDDSQITFNKLEIQTLEPIDVSGSFLIDNKPILTLAIKDADVMVDLAGSISLVDDSADHQYLIGELASDLSLWSIDLAGTVDADLPMYFPTESMPMGGSEADENEDGYPDHLLHIDGEFRGQNDYDFNFVAPNIDVSKLLFALLNDPEILLAGLEGFFYTVDLVADGIDMIELPLTGGEPFDNLARSLRGAREGVLGHKSGDDYSDGIGQWLQEQIENDNKEVFAAIINKLREALFDGLKSLNSDLFAFLVPDYDDSGKLQYDKNGKIKTRRPEKPEDIQLILTSDGAISFNLMFGGALVDGDLPIDFQRRAPRLEPGRRCGDQWKDRLPDGAGARLERDAGGVPRYPGHQR